MMMLGERRRKLGCLVTMRVGVKGWTRARVGRTACLRGGK